ncbi:MAG: hypothetical protein QOJ54_3171 [Aliidongia sp.]|nr:hypothetical protein [Aliidongia sp.]
MNFSFFRKSPLAIGITNVDCPATVRTFSIVVHNEFTQRLQTVPAAVGAMD